jgi:hypothetical protein
MNNLVICGTLQPKLSKDIKVSQLGVGMEKLDRELFKPEKIYAYLGKSGAKWVRIQSGWMRTEKQKGVYDFEWLDEVVDSLINEGINPWMCICYGNPLYDEEAKKYFGAVGVPPGNAESKKAWVQYTEALVARYKGKIDYFEIWNEPDGKHCWKQGPDCDEYAELVEISARAVKRANDGAKVIAGAWCGYCNDVYYTERFLQRCADAIDVVSFHAYTTDIRAKIFGLGKALKTICAAYNPKIKVIMGEGGGQSKPGAGALHFGSWTPRKQAKCMLNCIIASLTLGGDFVSYFSSIDMVEALNGFTGEQESYLDYGYFGLLESKFDRNGIACDYSPKLSYAVFANLASVFAEEFEYQDLPIYFTREYSPAIFENDVPPRDILYAGFRRKDGSAAIAYWADKNFFTTDYESTTSLYTTSLKGKVRVIDPMDGSIYEVPDTVLKTKDATGMDCFEGGGYFIRNIPIKDYPLIMTFGDFYKE